MDSLTQIFEKYKTPHQDGGDKGDVHSYIPEYEKLLAPYRNTLGNVLEIGVRFGSSMRMWEEYFPYANIYGLDVLAECKQYATDRTTIHIVDASKPEVLNKLGLISFDVIIDDGSHKLHHQTEAFKLLFPRLNPGGVYIIEDILNFERDRKTYAALHPSFKALDLRHVKGRGDDVLLIYRN